MVIDHWVNDEWALNSATHLFEKFPIPHSGDAAFAKLMDMIMNWDLAKSMKCATTDNVIDLFKIMRSLRIKLNGFDPG